MIRLAFAIAAWVVVFTPAFADLVDDCRKRDIAACDRLLQTNISASEKGETHINRGQAYYEKDNLDLALADFERAILLKARTVQIAYNNRGNVYYKRGEDKTAIESYTQALAIDPKFPAALTARGLLRKRGGDEEGARKDFAAALAAKPTIAYQDTPWAVEQAAQQLAYLNRPKAERECESKVDEPQIAACTAVIASGTKLAWVYANRGDAHLDMGNLDKAIDDLTEAMRLDQKPAFVSRALNSRAIAHRRKGNEALAIADYSAAIENDAGNADPHSNRGWIFLEKGDLDRAIGDFSNAIAADPKYYAAYKGRADAYAKKNEADKALVDLAKAIELRPKSASARNSRCWLRATRNIDLPLALVDCDEAIRLDPKEPDYLDSRGFLFVRLNRPADAIKDFDAALQLNPKKAHSLYGRGLAKTMHGDPGGDADMAAARAIDPEIERRFGK